MTKCNKIGKAKQLLYKMQLSSVEGQSNEEGSGESNSLGMQNSLGFGLSFFA